MNMGTICPYCNIEVSESSIEAEDGCCPECGAIISVNTIFSDPDGTAFDEDGDLDIDEEFNAPDFGDDLDTQGFGGDEFDDEFKEAFGEGFDDEEFQDEDFSLDGFNGKGFGDDDNY
jgi:hypothetical protein